MTDPTKTSAAPLTRQQPEIPRGPSFGEILTLALGCAFGQILGMFVSAALLHTVTAEDPEVMTEAEELYTAPTPEVTRAFDLCAPRTGVRLEYCIPAEEPMFRTLDHGLDP